MVRQRFELAADGPRERVDRALARLLPGTSRATVQRWISEGRVWIDGLACRARDTVGPGSVIELEPGQAPKSRAEPDESVRFGVLHEDEHLIVVDKPAGLVVHPARGHREGTLVNGLLARPGFGRPAADPRDTAGALRPGIVHRLDKDTSGVLVVAKDDPTREGLKKQLAVHSMERAYQAISLGTPSGGRIETLYGRHPRARLKFSSLVREGKRAITHLEVNERLAGGRAALVTCRLETGRTHQIRVHLAERHKTPVFADALYGGIPADPELRPIADELGRQALHAFVLGFVHPVTGERLRFEAALPSDLRRALERLRAL